MANDFELSKLGNYVTVNTTANSVLFASQIVIGNSTVNNTINATSVSGVPGVNVNANYTWTNTQTFSNTITFSSTIVGTANNASYLGGTPAASYALSSSLSSYQTTAGLSANVATLTSNNATYAFGKTEGAINANSALTANNSTYAFGKTEGAINANSALTANNASNLGGTAAASYALTSSLSSYQTTAGLSANVATLTANNASNLGGTAAASYALKSDTTYVGTTAVTLNRSSATQALTGITSVDSSTSTPPVFKANGSEIGQLCRTWVKYVGTGTPTINGSFNISSVTYSSTGIWNIAFTSALTDANWAGTMGTGQNATNNSTGQTMYSHTTTGLTHAHFEGNGFSNYGGSLGNYVSIAIIR